MGTRATEEIIDQMEELYKQGLSSDNIGKQLGTKGQTVTKYLKERGIEIRGPKKKLQEGDKEKMCLLYQEGLSAPKIAEKFGVQHTLVLRYLEDAGISRRSAEECHRKYPINEDFFDVIDTEEKAYFLGFMYADGCNHKEANYASLALDVSDREILVKLASLIYLENPESHVKIQDRTHENKGLTAYFTINSKHICKQLEKLGCIPAKTLKLEYPEWMPAQLHRHFIRGYFDGDGCLHLNTKLNESSYFKITSTKSFATTVKNIIKNNVNVNVGIYLCTQTSIVFDAQSAGDRQVEKIMKWLYSDSTIFMKRKHDIFIRLLTEINKTNTLIKAGTQGYQKRYLQK